MDIPTPDGGRIWIEDRGSGDPVVVISGMNQDHHALPMQRELEDEFRVIWLDKRGTGRSSDWELDDAESLTCGDFAEDVVTVLKALEIPRAHIVGFSMGGRIAQWIAIRFPKRVQSLILIGTSPGDAHGVPRDDAAERLMRAGRPTDLVLLNFTPAWVRRHPDLVAEIHNATTGRGAQREAHYHATHGHDSYALLPRISAPTLIVHGSEDKINPLGNAEILHERIPGSELVVVPGGRHAVAQEYSEAVNPRIREFLRAHALRAG